MSLSEALSLLDVDAADAAAVLSSMPSAEAIEPARWALVEGLANRRDNAQMPAGDSPLFAAHVIVAALDEIRRCHREFGIPDDISWKTLSFLGRAMRDWRAAHGSAGVQIGHWGWLRYCGRLYEVGRLEVIPYLLRTHPKEAGPLFWYDDAEAEKLGSGWRRGDPVLGLHVPPKGALDPLECDVALARLKTAFEGRYPGRPARIATCTSWLLDEQLADCLPADSNVARFQRRFTLVRGAQQNDEGIVRALWGKKSTLERAVTRHIEQGGHWYLRTGWLELP